MTDSATLRYDWLVEREGERLECKEAKSRFSYDELEEYCAAIANEGGGRIVLGVTDKPPRRIVGTAAFPAPEKEASRLTEAVGPLARCFHERFRQRIRGRLMCKEDHERRVASCISLIQLRLCIGSCA